jgi:hypothetical protein
MGKNTKSTEATLTAIYGESHPFELSYARMQQIENHCNILKDFALTPLSNGRKLHKNSKILSEKQVEIMEEGNAIEERRQKLTEMRNNPDATEETKKEVDELMLQLIEQTKAFNKAKHIVDLYLVKIDAYPKEPEKFGIKKVPMQNGTTVEVPYYSSFLELTDLIIVD